MTWNRWLNIQLGTNVKGLTHPMFILGVGKRSLLGISRIWICRQLTTCMKGSPSFGTVCPHANLLCWRKLPRDTSLNISQSVLNIWDTRLRSSIRIFWSNNALSWTFLRHNTGKTNLSLSLVVLIIQDLTLALMWQRLLTMPHLIGYSKLPMSNIVNVKSHL